MHFPYNEIFQTSRLVCSPRRRIPKAFVTMTVFAAWALGFPNLSQAVSITTIRPVVTIPDVPKVGTLPDGPKTPSAFPDSAASRNTYGSGPTIEQQLPNQGRVFDLPGTQQEKLDQLDKLTKH